MSSALPGPPTLRLFFALWPDSAVRARLGRHQALWQWSPPARPTPVNKLHLTLLFMEGVDVQRLAAVRQLGEEVSRGWTDFDLLLDRAAVWRHGGIASLAPSQIPPGLRDLHTALSAQAAQRGLPFDSRPYAPHVTLGRRAEKLIPPDAFLLHKDAQDRIEWPCPPRGTIHWPVRRFVLVRSVLGTGRYDLLGSWPVAGLGQ
ncbi:MAG: 2'-5' RNA ligase [Thiomonas sp. 20-64-5]|nr:MAG: 2'-5' RNA ligase [Thiomonas sp. 20-64-5]